LKKSLAENVMSILDSSLHWYKQKIMYPGQVQTKICTRVPSNGKRAYKDKQPANFFMKQQGLSSQKNW
jgi:hypothetical protein